MHCKKSVSTFLSPAGMSLTRLFPARESLVSDIPPGDGKIDNLFYSVGRICVFIGELWWLKKVEPRLVYSSLHAG